MDDSGVLLYLSPSVPPSRCISTDVQCVSVYFSLWCTRARQKIFTTFQFSQNQNIALRSYSLSSRLRVCVCVLALLYILFTICVFVCRFTISISIPRRFVFLFLFWNIRSKWLHWRATHVQFDVIYHINKTSAHHYHQTRAHFAAITIITMI